MRNTKRLTLIGASCLGVLSLLAAGFALRVNGTHAATGVQGTITHLSQAGTASMTGAGSATTDGTSNEFRPEPDVNEQIPRSSTIVHVSASHVPHPDGNAIASTNPGMSGFNGISHRDQRLAGTGAYAGTQFSLEPPDQALCVGNGFVLESVNTALAVYDASSHARVSGPTAINQFFHLAPEIIRSTLTFGDFTSDPKCLYDAGSQRWFFTVLQADVVPSTGAFTGKTHVYIGVSQTGDPTGAWNTFVLDTTDDGTNGTPSHPNCPCLGDQPLIGADANGFYVSTNEFPWSGGFNGAQVYAMSKAALVGGTTPTVVQFDAGATPTPDAGGIWYSIQPATTPAGGSFASDTEYFMSALQFSSANPLDNRIALWTLSGTSSLSNTSPSVSLAHAVIASEVYGQPPAAQQKNGPTPYGTLVHSPLALLDGGDDRMEQVVYADGKLWAGLNTVVQTPNGPTRVGIAYFVVSPSSASVVSQGYVSVNQENVLYPSIGVNSQGQGVMTFTLVGPDYFPSVAYTTLDATHGAGDIHIAQAGALPEDGFTGYKSPGFGGTSRWGDYSAAVADADGSIWIAAEYIPNAPRTLFANWGTYVSNVQP